MRRDLRCSQQAVPDPLEVGGESIRVELHDTSISRVRRGVGVREEFRERACEQANRGVKEAHGELRVSGDGQGGMFGECEYCAAGMMKRTDGEDEEGHAGEREGKLDHLRALGTWSRT